MIRTKRILAFTLIELLVVVAIIAVMVGLLLPAVQKARESASRTACANNLKQIGLAIHNYDSAFKKLPTSGEGIDKNGTVVMDKLSFFTAILPYVEQDVVYRQFDLNKVYNDGSSPQNQDAAKSVVATFLCPSNGYRRSGADDKGYGLTDYMPIVYTNLDASTGVAVSTKVEGLLRAGGSRMSECTDGQSNTAIIFENSKDPSKITANYPSAGSVDADPWRNCRWADPDSGNGVSGPPNGPGKKILNNNGQTETAACPWATHNCGINDEPASFHPSLCGGLHADGSVRFYSDDMNAATVRALCTPRGNEKIDMSQY